MYGILRVNVSQGTCSLPQYFQAIRACVKAQVLEGIPVAIIWGHNGGHSSSRRSHGPRPRGRYVVVTVADSRPYFLEHVDHLYRWSSCR
jgi:hypothetical protein